MRKYKKNLICPKCQSDNIAHYQYGLVEMYPELKKNIDKGKVVLGGCCITNDDPDRHCNDCEYDW